MPRHSESGSPEESNFSDIFSLLWKVANSIWTAPARSELGLGLLFSLVEPILVPFVFRRLFDVVDDESLTCKSDAGAASSPARAIVST